MNFLGQLWFKNEMKKKHSLMFWSLRRVYLSTTWGTPMSWIRPSLSAVWSVGISYHAFQPGCHYQYCWWYAFVLVFLFLCFCCSCSCNNIRARGHNNIYHQCHFHLNEKNIFIAVEKFLRTWMNFCLTSWQAPPTTPTEKEKL